MKKQTKLRVLCRVLAALMLLSALALPAMALTAHAEETAADAEYEAKKQAYREKIMADEVTTDDLLIGSWVTFYSFETDSYEYQLDQMAAAGLNFNLFPRDFGSGAMFDAEYWNNVEEQYAKRNMIYHMNGSMAEKNIAIGVEFAAGKKHCVGYHLVDEPTADKFPEIARLVKLYREADPTRCPIVNLFPSYAPEWALGGTYEQHVTNFVQTIGPENIEYLSHDYYPFRDGGVVLTDIFADMEVLRKVAYENGKLKTHAFPQSTAWNGTRMPTEGEMRWNVYGYLAYGFKALSWFNLVCPGRSDDEGECFRESVIYRDGTVKNPQLLKDFGKLNAEVHALGDTLMKLDTVHAYHTTDRIGGVERLPEDWMITPVGDVDFVISHMVTAKGDETYVMLFNNSWENPATATFTVHPLSGIEGLTYVSPWGGNEYPVTVTDGRFTETFRPGEGKLFKLNGILTRKVLPIQRNPARLNLEIPEVADLAGLDVTFSADTDMKASTLQITTNKRFPEEKTLYLSFDHDPADKGGNDKGTVPFPKSGKIRFDAYPGKHIRFTVHDEASWYNHGYAEIRVRYACEGDALAVTEAEDTVTAAQAVLYEDLDFTALDEAIAAFEARKESHYTADSWRAAKNFYEAALDMKSCTYPQNAVTVGAWKLMDSIRDLVPAIDLPAEEAAPAVRKSLFDRFDLKSIKVDKGILTAAVATLAGAAAGIAAGVLTVLKRRNK